MHGRNSLASAAVFAACAVAALPAAQGPEGTAVVRGRVVDGLSGKPLASLQLQFSPQPRGRYAPGIDAEPPSRSVITGSDGTFELQRLVAFDYSVYASARSDYPEIAYGIAKPGGRGKLLTVADGARLDIVIRAWRGATLRGHVFDERGRPIVGAEVRVFEKDDNVYGSGLSDDLGAYEITRLRPGQYAVGVPIWLSNRTLSASPPARQPPSGTVPFVPFVLDRAVRTVLMPHGAPLPAAADDGRARIYTPAFAGGATAKERALYLPLGPGDVREGIDITLPAVRGARISGIVTSPGDVKGAILTLLPFDGPRTGETGRIDATAAADGTFVFVATPPGRYVLSAYRREPPLTEITLTGGSPLIAMDDVIGHDPEDLWAEMPFTVGDADVEDVAIMLLRGTPVTGRIVFDDETANAPPNTPNNAWPRIMLAGGEQRSSFEDRYVQVQRDGTIATRIRPGAYRVVAGPMPQGRLFKTAIVNGQDIGDGLFTIGADPLNDVQFVYGRYQTALGGTVTDRSGNAAANATVLVFSADRERWLRLEESGRWRAAHVSNGAFEVTGLPPGDYFAVAVGDYRTSMSREMAAELAPRASRVTVREGPRAILTLTVGDPE